MRFLSSLNFLFYLSIFIDYKQFVLLALVLWFLLTRTVTHQLHCTWHIYCMFLTSDFNVTSCSLGAASFLISPTFLVPFFHPLFPSNKKVESVTYRLSSASSGLPSDAYNKGSGALLLTEPYLNTGIWRFSNNNLFVCIVPHLE